MKKARKAQLAAALQVQRCTAVSAHAAVLDAARADIQVEADSDSSEADVEEDDDEDDEEAEIIKPDEQKENDAEEDSICVKIHI